jgi:PQQ enzyme repeat
MKQFRALFAGGRAPPPLAKRSLPSSRNHGDTCHDSLFASFKENWRTHENYPTYILPTNRGLVFFGDVGGNFYAVDAANGRKLWGQKIDGASAGGVITYTANGAQKITVTTGFISPAFPAEIRWAKIAILGLDGASR